jgi:hypothetical protein
VSRPRDISKTRISAGGYRATTRRDLRLSYRIPELPRGELHPYSRCAYCDADADLHSTVLAVTRAWAMVCNDPIACRRRFHSE